MPSSNDDQLIHAASKCNLDNARRLLTKGANPNAMVKGTTALNAAVSTSRFSLPFEMIDLLLSYGAQVDGLNEDQSTPLMIALLIGKSFGSRTAAHLIEHGANVKYVRMKDLASPISHAVTRASPDVLKLLIVRGAPVDGPPARKITPLMRAVVENNLDAGKILLESGADITLKCTLPWAKGKTAADIAVEKKRSSFVKLFSTKT